MAECATDRRAVLSCDTRSRAGEAARPLPHPVCKREQTHVVKLEVDIKNIQTPGIVLHCRKAASSPKWLMLRDARMSVFAGVFYICPRIAAC